MNREETLELLREAHREPIPEAHYAAVRARVLSQLATERRPWSSGIWAYGFAAAALAALLIAAFWPKQVAEPVGQALSPVNRALSQTGLASALALAPAPVEVSLGRRKRLPHHIKGAAPYRVIGPPISQPLVVKLVTSDPNVVIYWIAGE